MTYIAKPKFHHPGLTKNRLGYTHRDYEGKISTLCAGCGHDSITASIIEACYELSIEPHRVAKISGIGCSSKTPDYFLGNSHGFNTVHGRMPSVLTGANLANRDLIYLGVSGDGDSASIGFGQFAHSIRRGVNMTYIVENNGVYGLTKGQFSATADRVHLKAPGTDLRFSIKGIGAKMCKGDRNIPDGEVFSCPTKFSVNGTIQFNTPTLYSGTKFENVRLDFDEGKIIKATANNTKRINEILDTDAGARYVGEFSLGFNPYILSPMCDILFDEKIAGSLHFTPGQAYEECDNGNRSAVHWDMVLIQRPEWGGGEVWFDGELIRKNGQFLPRDLKPLNPSNLK